MSPKANSKQTSNPEVKEKTDIQKCTIKELKFLDYLFGEAQFNATKAYKLAGFQASPQNARIAASKLSKKLYPIIRQWLDEAGLTENHLKFKLIRLLDAKETKFFSHEGKVTDQRGVEALGIQIKALELAMKAKGMLSEKSAREVDQIDQLIEIELEKLGVAREAG